MCFDYPKLKDNCIIPWGIYADNVQPLVPAVAKGHGCIYPKE